MPIVRDEIIEGNRHLRIVQLNGNRACLTGFDDGSVVIHTDEGDVDPDSYFPVHIVSGDVEQLIAFLSQIVEDGQEAEDAA